MSSAKPINQPIGLDRDAKHMYRWNDGPWVPGVTSIIAQRDRPWLVNWAKKATAESAIRNHKLLGDLIDGGGSNAAVNWLKEIPDYIRDTAADLGTKVHYLAEQIGRGETPTEVEESAKKRAESYLQWERAYKPEFLMVEFMVYNEDLLYGGTGDVFLYLNPCPANECQGKNERHLWMIDYKTGSTIDATTGLQLAGLKHASWIGKKNSPEKIAIPVADHYGVLHIQDESSTLFEYQVRESEWEAFQACRRLWTWGYFESKSVKIKPKGYA